MENMIKFGGFWSTVLTLIYFIDQIRARPFINMYIGEQF